MSEVRFARSGDIDVAYRVVGDGPIDLVSVEGSYTHLEILWELPAYRSYYERLAEFARVIVFDKRGMGMSDRVPGATSLEVRMDDIRAVLNAVGSERAAIMGESEGGPLAMLFAAAHPERTVALILQGSEVRERRDDEWPWGDSTQEQFDAAVAQLPERWGQGNGMQHYAPSIGDAPWARTWLARLQRYSCTPASWEAFARMAFDIDVRLVAGAINVPTLILHAVDDTVCHVENARCLARTVRGAKYVELPGGDHLAWFEPEQVIGEIREFLTGRRETRTPDRVLATVLFTDLVGSTTIAAEKGDRKWRDLLAQHYAAVRRELDRFDGSEVDTSGDGFLATFDGPARAIRCAQALVESARALDLEVRAGLHTGEVEMLDGKVAGIAVHIGARVMGRAGAGQVFVSGTVKDLVAGSGIAFEDRGVAELKGLPGEWRLFAVAPS
ncbi:MAG: adenylate/guanylate cyclase domain-containing protein [Jatrophihabitans sp.]|uniref:adenylate/guanylate cyclase domain-containing protein n=1 Tax=Jatrophihabitans sp. TaxID=1932789 RepID=UPI0039100794